MYDEQFLIAPLAEAAYPAYNPTDIKDHVSKWYATICDACKKLASYNLSITQGSGKQSGNMKCILKDVYKLKEKAHRMFERVAKYTDNELLMHDLHVWDDWLHEKMKRKEEKK
jgi:hypothetical protein